MMNRSRIVTIASAVMLALANSASSTEPGRLAEAVPQQTADAVRLPERAGWSAILALAGVLALTGGIIVMTRRRSRGAEASR